MARRRKPGIWAMEADWSTRVSDVRSVSPVLSALKEANVAQVAHRRINTDVDLIKELKRFGQQQHNAYTIGYVAMHGSPGTVYVGRKSIDLLKVTKELPLGRLSAKVLHFGSCSVLTDDDQQRELLARFGARAITGFTADVDWFEALAFEILLFEALTRYKRIDAVEKYLRKNFGDFADRVGFVMVR